MGLWKGLRRSFCGFGRICVLVGRIVGGCLGVRLLGRGTRVGLYLWRVVWQYSAYNPHHNSDHHTHSQHNHHHSLKNNQKST